MGGPDFGGAGLGALFNVLYDGLKELIGKNVIYKTLLKAIISRLDILHPLIKEIAKYNKDLDLPDKELENLKVGMEKGIELVHKCSKIRAWNIYKKYKYANKLLDWNESLLGLLDMLNVQGIRDVKGSSVSVRNIEKVVSRIESSLVLQYQDETEVWGAAPELPALVVGLDFPLKELKRKLLNFKDGVSMLVLTAPGGCGKTTLATAFCQDQEVKDTFGDNIFFVTVSSNPNLERIVQELHLRRGSKVPTLGNEINAVKWLHHFLKEEGQNPLLLVLDDVWSGSESLLEKFDQFKMPNYKLLVTSRSEFRGFGVLVREANSYTASKVIVGTAQNHHKIRSSTTVAKYCAKKLSKDCGVLAVNNGKVVFNREGSQTTYCDPQGSEDRRRNGLLTAFHRSLHKSSKVLNEGSDSVALKDTYGPVDCQKLEQGFAKLFLESSETVAKQKCSICSRPSVDNSCHQSAVESSADDGEDRSMAIVPVQKEEEAAASSISMLIRELPEARPGWPLLRRAVLPDQQISERSLVRKISVVQWAMQLPSRQPSATSNFDDRRSSCDPGEDQPFCLNGESGAIVAVGSEAVTAPPSPDHSSKGLPKELEGLHEKYSATCRLFTYKELQSATSYFLAENFIGRGGSSQVYRGCLPDGKELAVKILKPSEDVLKEFVLEIEIITTLNHNNIISLLGFCFEDNNLLLVYDFLSRGSLEENLHGSKKDPLTFGWNERYKVAVGVAEALDYLHTSSAQPVIHRDVKSSNILLSDDFEPQLSDFGLAKWASTSSSHITCTDVAGTFGYLAPEYFMYGKVNDKIDVYAFGVVLLELLSGRKPISSDYPKGHESLVMWAKPILSGGKVSQLLDPCLSNDYNQDQIERMVLAATLCIRHAPRARPQMSFIVKLLQGDADAIKWARLQVHALEESDVLEDEACPRSNLQSHLNLALLDVEDDSLSMSSIEQSVSLEDYLKGRWSRSSSFD